MSLGAPARAQWNLGEMFVDEISWKEQVETYERMAKDLVGWRGKLGANSGELRRALELRFELEKLEHRLGTWAALRLDEDRTDPARQAVRARWLNRRGRVAGLLEWFPVEIATLDPEFLDSEFPPSAARSAAIRRRIELYRRQARHSFSGPEAERMREAVESGRGLDIAQTLLFAEIPWPEVEGPEDGEVAADTSSFASIAAWQDAGRRREALRSYFETLDRYRRSLALALTDTLTRDRLEADWRGFDSTLDAALWDRELPRDLVPTLVTAIRSREGLLRRYLALRSRLAEVSEPTYYDLWAPIPEANAPKPVEWADAVREIVAAARPIGEEYAARLETALASDWVDPWPRAGKHGGAFVASGPWEGHPFLLMNFRRDRASVSTLAHESGHLMQELLVREHQPYATSKTPAVLGEVAAYVHEWLLLRERVETSTGRAREVALVHMLDRLHAALFRIALQTEFEMGIHREVAAGEGVDADRWSTVLLGLFREAYGERVEIPKSVGAEWASIPHLHHPFYLFQYATSFASALVLVDALRSEPCFASRYREEFLGAGSSRPPLTVLSKLGVDLESGRVLDAAFDWIEAQVEQLEEPP